MRITEEQDKRMSESRRRLMRAFYVALGSYIEQEAKKLDQWRDESFGQLYGHLKHEVVTEIGGSKSRTAQIHNCMDSAMLSLFMLDKILEEDSYQLQRVVDTISEMERATGVVRDDDLLKSLLGIGLNISEIDRIIGVLMREGTIYSPRPGYYKRT